MCVSQVAEANARYIQRAIVRGNATVAGGASMRLPAPMLQDPLWCKLAAEKEVLCAGCCFKRAFERDIDLTRGSLPLCVLNLTGWPWFYFNLSTDAKKQSSERAQHLYERYLKTWGVQDPDEVPHQRRSRQHKLPAQKQQGIAL